MVGLRGCVSAGGGGGGWGGFRVRDKNKRVGVVTEVGVRRCVGFKCGVESGYRYII